jgi:hypothetical protein
MKKRAGKRPNTRKSPSSQPKPQRVAAVVAAGGNHAQRTARLGELEQIINNGLRTYVQVGRALKEIRDQKLYLAEGYETFIDYLKRRFGWAKSYGHSVINASVVTERLSAIADKVELPANEGQARPLVGLKPDEATAVWKKVIAESKKDAKPITAEHVSEIATKMYPKCAKKSAKRRADRRGDPANVVPVSELSTVDETELRNRPGEKQISLLILNGTETDSSNLIPRLAPSLSDKAVIVALARWNEEDVVLDAIGAAGLTLRGRIILYDDGNHSRKNAGQPGSAHRALWIASQPKRPKVELPDPLDARGKLSVDGSLPDDVLELIVRHLSNQKDAIFVAHDPGRSAGLVCHRVGRVALSVQRAGQSARVRKAA